MQASKSPDEVYKRQADVSDTELPCRITLLQALPEDEKMDWIVAKAVELGACEIVPMQTARSEALSRSVCARKIRHWNDMASEEASHAFRSFVPQVKPVLSFADAVKYASGFDRKLIPYEMERGMKKTREEFAKIRPGDSVAVLIGPERGFAPEEIVLSEKAGIVPITLGHRVLRTETAGMSVLSVLVYLLEQDW